MTSKVCMSSKGRMSSKVCMSSKGRMSSKVCMTSKLCMSTKVRMTSKVCTTGKLCMTGTVYMTSTTRFSLDIFGTWWDGRVHGACSLLVTVRHAHWSQSDVRYTLC